MSSNIEPSGRLQILEPKDFPFLHTGKSLVFTIARNGHVWGKRLDNESARGDVELEVFWPVEEGCLIRERSDGQYTTPLTVPEMRSRERFSKEQFRKIETILSQKEKIQYELGTLMVRPFVTADPNYKDWRHLPQYKRVTTKPKIDFPSGEPRNIKIVDCSYGENSSPLSYQGCWQPIYESLPSEFKFTSRGDMVSRHNKEIFSGLGSVLVGEISRWMKANLVGTTYFYVSRAENKKFNVADWEPCKERRMFKPELKIMYGEQDFFNYFTIDDAALLLEITDFANSNRNSQVSWTLAIAQNKLVREMMRLASNNPDLFDPLFQQDEYKKLMWGRKNE